MVHHLDVEHGLIGPDTVRRSPTRRASEDADFYVCAARPRSWTSSSEPSGRTGSSRLASTSSASPRASGRRTATRSTCRATTRVTIELDGRTDTTDHHPGTTILQTARQMGMSPPFSCESGSCATCMARLVEGSVSMFVNNALTDDEVDDGWILTCQSVPTSPVVHVVYGSEE